MVFRFSKEEDREKVLQGGPYNVYGRPVVLKVMPQEFDFSDCDTNVVPIWVNLPNLPLCCWSEEALSKIASVIGIPITTDALTASMNRISYARILIEVDLAKQIKNEVKVTLPSGRTIIQKVLYEHMPKYCGTCKAFGHTTTACRWRSNVDRKQKEQEKDQEVGKARQEYRKIVDKGKKILGMNEETGKTREESGGSNVRMENDNRAVQEQTEVSVRGENAGRNGRANTNQEEQHEDNQVETDSGKSQQQKNGSTTAQINGQDGKGDTATNSTGSIRQASHEENIVGIEAIEEMEASSSSLQPRLEKGVEAELDILERHGKQKKKGRKKGKKGSKKAEIDGRNIREEQVEGLHPL